MKLNVAYVSVLHFVYIKINPCLACEQLFAECWRSGYMQCAKHAVVMYIPICVLVFSPNLSNGSTPLSLSLYHASLFIYLTLLPYWVHWSCIWLVLPFFAVLHLLIAVWHWIVNHLKVMKWSHKFITSAQEIDSG